MVSLRDTSCINQWKRLRMYESPVLVTDLCGSFFLCRLHFSRMISISNNPLTDSGFFSNCTTCPLPYHSIPTSSVPQPLVVELNSGKKFTKQIYQDTQERGRDRKGNARTRNPILPMGNSRHPFKTEPLSTAYPRQAIKCFRRWRSRAGLSSILYVPLGFILSPNTK